MSVLSINAIMPSSYPNQLFNPYVESVRLFIFTTILLRYGITGEMWKALY
jgi:hypothetical protein